MNFLKLIMLTAVFALVFSSCKKDSTSTPASSATQTATAQDAESQDALLTNVEQGADNQADALEAAGFAVSDAKSASVNGISISINNNKYDTINFPKIITLNYNFSDTVNGEIMGQTGQIIITVDTIPVHKKLWWRKHISRTFSFNNFTVTNDSSSFTVNGTRTMQRLNWIQSLSDNKLKLNVEIKDTINSSFDIGITCGAYTGSFTRRVKRGRDIKLHYYKVLAGHNIWHPLFTDTTTFTGNVEGTNLQDSAYSRTITKPLMYTVCPVWPHNILASGEITDIEGSRLTTITYTPDGCKNKITATDTNGNVVKIDRKINRKFKKWWK